MAQGRLYTVTELAKELGMTARAVRFYEDKGLITPQRAGTTRVYSARDRARMILILRGKRLGFSLSAIKEYLDLYDTDITQHAQLRVLLAGRRQAPRPASGAAPGDRRGLGRTCRHRRPDRGGAENSPLHAPDASPSG